MASRALEDGHAVAFQKCFDSGLQYVHDLDIKKRKKETNSSEVFCSQLWPQGQHGAQPPAPASYLLQGEAKAKTEVAAARGDSIREKA